LVTKVCRHFCSLPSQPPPTSVAINFGTPDCKRLRCLLTYTPYYIHAWVCIAIYMNVFSYICCFCYIHNNFSRCSCVYNNLFCKTTTEDWGPSETLRTIHQPTRHHIPGHRNLRIHRRDNLESRPPWCVKNSGREVPLNALHV
jgi:hypothetical protein